MKQTIASDLGVTNGEGACAELPLRCLKKNVMENLIEALFMVWIAVKETPAGAVDRFECGARLMWQSFNRGKKIYNTKHSCEYLFGTHM